MMKTCSAESAVACIQSGQRVYLHEASMAPLAYVPKPVRPRHLVDTVRTLLEARAPVPATAVEQAEQALRPMAELDPDVRALLPGFAQRGLKDLDAARQGLMEEAHAPARTAGHRLKGTGDHGIVKVGFRWAPARA